MNPSPSGAWGAAPEILVTRSGMDEKKYRIYICGGVHCTPRGCDAILRALEGELWEHELEGDVDVRVSGCQNRCDFGPNATVWPGPVRYAALTLDAVRRIVIEHLRDGRPVDDLVMTPEP